MSFGILMNDANFRKELKALQLRINLQVNQATDEVAEEIMQDSRENYCPVVSGRLKASGKVVREASSSMRYQVRLVYDAPYAEVVHERPKSYGQGKNKYLEQPFLKAKPDLAARILARVTI